MKLVQLSPIHTNLTLFSFTDAAAAAVVEQPLEEASEQVHECPQCFKSYNYRKNLLRHLKYECGVAAKESCRFCPYVTRYKHSLKVHLMSQHSAERIS